MLLLFVVYLYNKIKQIEIMTTVYHSTKGQCELIENQGFYSLVDFGNGAERVLSVTLKNKAPKEKVKSYMKEEVIEADTFNSIVRNLKGSAQDRNSMLFFGENIYNTIEKIADSQNHFSGQIISDARNGKFISEKQAMVVAYFAKNNGLIK